MHQFLKFIFGIKLYMFRTVPLSIIISFFTVQTAMVLCHTGYSYSLRAGSGRNCSSVLILLASCMTYTINSVLILLASCQQNCMTYLCCVYSEKHLMMDRGTVRNM